MGAPKSANFIAPTQTEAAHTLRVAINEVSQRGIDQSVYRSNVQLFEDTMVITFIDKYSPEGVSMRGSIGKYPAIEVAIDAKSLNLKNFSFVR